MRNIQRFSSELIEGTARVVRVEGNVVWLEPEQGASCGSCASAQACGSKGMGSLAQRLEMRRFPLENEAGLVRGERVVVGVQETALVNAALLAYGVPLATMLAVAATAQWIATTQALVPLAAAAGLAAGLGIAHVGARRFDARGGLSPRLLRRADAGCTIGEEGGP